MAGGGSTRTVRTVVFVAVVLFAFWRPLFAGGTLAPDDQAWSFAPFNADAPADLSIEVAEPDASAIHSAWTRWADDLRDGDLSQLGDGRTGAPTLADGVPVTHLLYLVVPSWYAPGLVAAAAVLLAMFGAARLVAARGGTDDAALVGGLAFGLSGLVFVWIGWPHATAFALVPWVLAAAIDTNAGESGGWRRLAGWTAALLWCGVFAIAGYTLVAVVALLVVERARRGALATAGSLVLGAALAAPHLLASSSRSEWADAAAWRDLGDTSAGFATVLTTALASLWGDDAVGFPWIGESSAQQSVAFVGLVVLLGAAVGVATAERGRLVLPGLWLGIGFAVAYVGGPFETVSDLVAGGQSTMTHARVLLVLGLVLLAADGTDGVVADQRDRLSFRRPTGTGAVVGLVAVVVLAIAALDWLDTARAAGAVRAALAESVLSVLVAAVFAGVVVAWRRHILAPPAVVVAAAGLIAFELLSYGMAVPTVTDRGERLSASDAHVQLAELVGADGLVVGEGRALPPAVSARFDLADVRVPRVRSEAEVDALTAVEADAFLLGGGGDVDRPFFSAVDPDAPVWTTLGVDAVVQAPGRRPPGPTTQVRGDAVGRIDAGVVEPVVPIAIDGGLRAIELDLQAPVATPVQVDVAVQGRVVFGDTVVVTGSPVFVPVDGDDLPDGPATVTVRVLADPETATLGVDAAGTPTVGVVGAAPETDLVVFDGLLVTSRPTPPARTDAGDPITVIEVDDRTLTVEVTAAAATDLWTDIVDRPGWSVTIDGATGYLAGDVVLGTEVPAGTSVVEFRYTPPGLVLGGALIVLALLALLLVGPASAARGTRSGEVAAGSVPSRD